MSNSDFTTMSYAKIKQQEDFARFTKENFILLFKMLELLQPGLKNDAIAILAYHNHNSYFTKYRSDELKKHYEKIKNKYINKKSLLSMTEKLGANDEPRGASE